jgi:hypothetical protein
MKMSEKEYNAEEVFEIIQNMSNGERLKLLEKMYDKYYSKEHLHLEEEDLEEDDY